LKSQIPSFLQEEVLVMATLMQDLRYGCRVLLKNPGFTLVAILTLGLGIGFNTAIFSIVNAVLLRQLPFRNPEQLVWIWATRIDRDKAFFSIPNFKDFRDQNQTLEQMAAYANWGANLTDGGEPERLQGARVTANAFEMLGMGAAVGRTLLIDDEKAEGQRSLVMTYGLWQRRFGADRSVVGRKLTLNGDAYTVVGVLPQSFMLPGTEAEIFIPLALDSDPRRTERGSNFLRAFARLKPGVTREQAQADLATISERLKQQYPDDNAKMTAPKAFSLRDEIVGSYQAALLLLLGAVGLVLLIACSNLANLLLAKASARRKEVAIRMALGASRGRLIRQLLTESVVLALFGGSLGLFLALWGIDLLVALSPVDLPRAQEIAIDQRVLAFTAGLSLLAGLGFGLTPALQASRLNLNEEFKGESRGASGGVRRNRTRNLLVVFELAISLVLLVGAGLLVKSFMRLQQVSPGFEPSNMLLVRLSLPQSSYSTPQSVAAFYQKLAPRIEGLPGVQGVGLANVLPLSASNTRTDFSIVGRPPLSPSEMPGAQNRWVSPGYFQTMRVPLLAGREFTEQDGTDSPGVVVIDEALAHRFFKPDESPIGFHLRIDDGAGEPREVEIVGVSGDVKHFGLDDEPTPTLYAPVYQVPKGSVSFLISNMSLVVRSSTDPMAQAAAVRREVQAIDKDVPASSTKTMEQFLSASVAPRRFSVLLLGIFAGTALLLAAIGIYAVISYLVTQRTHEIGIRMALGAGRRDILTLVVGQGMTLALVGIGIGLVAAFMLTRVMSSLLFNVSATDPTIFAAVSIVLALVALLAIYIPARRAMRVDPMEALRYE
jgi:predicted permease